MKLIINLIGGPYLPIPPIRGGGVETFIYDLALELSKRHRVRIYSRRYPGLKGFERIGDLEIIRLPGFNKGVNRFLDLMKEFVYGLRLLFALATADVNHFFHLRSFLVYSIFKPKKGVTVIHLHVLFGGITAKFLKFADMVVPCSDYIKRYFQERCNLVNSKMTVIPNGVDTRVFKKMLPDSALIKRYDLAGYKVIGYVGRITAGKGLEYLMGAFRIVRTKRQDVKLLMIGPYHKTEYGDPLVYSRLVRLAQEYRIMPYVLFTGLIEHGRLPDYYETCDILCFPSDWEEAFGLGCLEAMGCGKPVIATDVNAFKEIVEDGVNGFIVPKCAPAAIAERILLLLNDDSLGRRIGQAALERARLYSYESIAKKCDILYGNFLL